MVGWIFWLFTGGIVYTYAGYPVLLALLAPLARTRRKSGGLTSSTPPVTMLIAAFNEQDVIAEKLENTLALDYPHDCLQILVATDGSTDGTVDLVRVYANRGVELSHREPRCGKLAAINRAIARARGEIVVFSDANNSYACDALRELVTPFADPTVGAVTGAKTIQRGDGVLGESEGLYWRYESFIKERESQIGCCTAVAGEVLAIRRGLYEPAPDHIINDDFYIALRLVRRGYRVVYAPNARSSERVSLTAHDEVVRRARIIAGRYQALALAANLVPWRRPVVVWQLVSHKFLRPLVPLAMIGALVANLIAVVRPTRSPAHPILHLAPPVDRALLSSQVVFYGLAVLGGRVKRGGKIGGLLYLPTFLLNSNLAALIGLYRFGTKRQSTLWVRAPRAQGPHAPGIQFDTG